jgi:hypothetical protein
MFVILLTTAEENRQLLTCKKRAQLLQHAGLKTRNLKICICPVLPNLENITAMIESSHTSPVYPSIKSSITMKDVSGALIE